MSWWNTAASWASTAMSSSSSSGNKSNIWGSIISGIGSVATGYLGSKSKDKDFANSLEAIALQSAESRKNLQFAAQLEDFYNQTNKQRKRMALNSYGKYNLMGDIMPTSTPDVAVPTAPTA